MDWKPAGLTGGIATGKSTVAAYFRECGAVVIDGDRVAGEVMSAGSDILDRLARVFGEEILLPSGDLNRRRMLDILRDRPQRLRDQLTALAPGILPEIDRRAANAHREHPQTVIVVEAPLLFEYGRPERYAPVIVVYVPRKTQIHRLMQRSGRDREWAASVVDIQIPTDKKAAAADYVIDNSGDPETTRRQVRKIYRELQAVYLT